MRRAALLVPVALAGCAYDPGLRADRGAGAYGADLKACRAEASAAVDKEDAQRFLVFLASPVTDRGRRHAKVDNCMAAKGYKAG